AWVSWTLGLSWFTISNDATASTREPCGRQVNHRTGGAVKGRALPGRLVPKTPHAHWCDAMGCKAAMASEHDVEITTEQGAIETTYLYGYASRACSQVRRITERGDAVHPERPVVASERGGPLTASSVTQWFFPLYRDVGMTGWSSHSGRRTFITRAARKVS